MARSDKVRVGVCAEVVFATDPSASGALYLPAQFEDAPHFQWDQQLEPANYATGRARHNGEHMSNNGVSVPFTMPMLGLSTAATDAAPIPVVKDFQDQILDSAFATASTYPGEGIAASGSALGIVVTDTGMTLADDLILVNQAARSDWRYIASASGVTVNVTPNFTAIPDGARDVIGHKLWSYNETVGGATLALYQEIDATPYLHLGGKPTSLKIVAEAGKEAKYQGSFMFDRKSRLGSVKASFPAAASFSNPPVRFALSELYWGSTAIPIKKCEIDFRLESPAIMSHDGLNGRGTIETHAANPRITIEPAFNAALEDDFEAGTTRNLLIAFGSGRMTAARVSTCCFFSYAAQIKKVGLVKDGKYLRQQIVLDVTDPGIRTGSTPYRFWALGRA